jgi:tol-pal system protein YbgF
MSSLNSGLIAAVLTAACGCATAPKPTAAPVDPERTILELRAKNAGYVKRIEELENRVFILEDQLDSRALASEQRAPATLPVRLPASKTAGPGDRPAAEEPVQTSLVAEHAVDYAGEAAASAAPGPGAEPSAHGKRPMLRLSASGSSGSVSRAPEPRSDGSGGAPTRPVAPPLKLYRQALDSLRGGHPEVARAGFRRFLDANPQHEYADNALYWIGECDYAAGNLSAAERSFRTVVERYPRGNKVPDAMLKLGFTLQSLGDEGAARAVLESLTRAFPAHEAARLAAARLARTEAGGGSTGRAPPHRTSDKVLGTIAP